MIQLLHGYGLEMFNNAKILKRSIFSLFIHLLSHYLPHFFVFFTKFYPLNKIR
jgi:hypothetical protein